MSGEAYAITWEICNGMMCIGALMLVDTFLRYIFREVRENKQWEKDVLVVSALSLTLLFMGHAFQRFVIWMQFLGEHIGADMRVWQSSIALLFATTVLILLGKVLAMYFFAPAMYRNRYTVIRVGLMLTIPIIVAVIAEVFYDG